MVTCSDLCQAVMFTIGQNIGNFLFSLPGDFRYGKFAKFAPLDFDGDHWLSLVVYGLPPMDDIFLNGESLSDKVWNVIDPFSLTQIPIEKGVSYTISSVGEKTFGAYVYCHFDGEVNGGYSFSVEPQGQKV